MPPYLSVIIPAYNEAERIPLTLVDIDRHLRQRKFSYEILVVNDGSTDETAKIVKKMMPVIKNLKLMDNDINRGKGAVARQGMLLASGKYRLFTDADNSTSIDQFDKMIPRFGEGYDVVIGSRATKGSQLDPPQSIYRQIPGKIGNLIIQFLLLPGIWDTQCGFKAFTAEAAEKIFSIMKITKWGFDIEALALAKHLGFRMKEIPVHWINNPFSHVRASAYLQVLLETCKIRWWLWTSSYKL
jgi:glycosyltransferase involved in cell wall biosynthesis